MLQMRPQLLHLLSVAFLLLSSASAICRQEAAPPDPAKIVGPEACRDCHTAEYRVWQNSPHASGFRTLHRRASAEIISARLGLGTIQGAELCQSCHYTVQAQGERLQPIAGVSCESCHGPARDWLTIHGDYGESATFAAESAAHRNERQARSAAAGMRGVADLYSALSSCFGCHTVADEKLVNTGGHPAGAVFELLPRLHAIRHNFLQATRDGSDVNADPSPERLRIIYIAGKALELEYTLRGMATAREDGLYARAMARRANAAQLELSRALHQVPIAEMTAALASVREIAFTINNRRNLLRTADRIRDLNQEFIRRHDGSTLAALDRHIGLHSVATGHPAPPKRTSPTPAPGGETPILAPPAAPPHLDLGIDFGAFDLPLFPEITDTTSVEAILLAVKQRLERIYAKLERSQ